MGGRCNTDLRIELAIVQFRAVIGVPVLQRGRIIIFVKARIAEIVVGSLCIPCSLDRALRAPAKSLPFTTTRTFHHSRSYPHLAIGHTDKVQLSVPPFWRAWFFGAREDDTADGITPITDARGSFYNGHSCGNEGVYLRRMVVAPVLTFLPHPIVHDQDAIAIYPMNDGFGDGRPCLKTVHSRNAFQ